MLVVASIPNGGANQNKPNTPTTDTCAKANGFLCVLFTTANLPTLYLVLIGVGGVVAAMITLEILSQQVEAARLSAQAVINSERPWLIVNVNVDKEKLFRFGCLNQGRTPAKIVSISAKTDFVESLDALPVPPDYISPVEMPDLDLIVRRDSFPIGKGIDPDSVIKNAGKNSVVGDSREFLIYYGNVIYRDTLYPDSSPEGLHETRWCFVYQPNGETKFVRSGPKEYNGYT
ncbi:MAG TPA: hypothetical protein VGZ48_07535 [Candidatus Acidoferrales bacterium]|jgi:hypothetical protein|nr:hypothetical protein [Candidatus Acidoferrales bacterium]